MESHPAQTRLAPVADPIGPRLYAGPQALSDLSSAPRGADVLHGVTGGRDRVHGVYVRRKRAQQGTERRLVLGGEAAEDVLLGSGEALVQVVEDRPAVVGGHHE